MNDLRFMIPFSKIILGISITITALVIVIITVTFFIDKEALSRIAFSSLMGIAMSWFGYYLIKNAIKMKQQREAPKRAIPSSGGSK